MAQTITAPDTIPMSKVRAFLADLGLNTTYLRELVCGMNGVYVEVMAQDADGKPYFVPGTNEVAVHRISMRLDLDA